MVKLGVVDARTGDQKTFDLCAASLPDNAWWTIRWTPDGSNLTYALSRPEGTNLWIQPVAGGPPQQLTHFRDDVISYAWSPDGARLAVARETDSTDVVLFKNFH